MSKAACVDQLDIHIWHEFGIQLLSAKKLPTSFTTPCQSRKPPKFSPTYEVIHIKHQLIMLNQKNLHINGFTKPEHLTERAHLSPLHTPVPPTHHTYPQKKNSRINFIQKNPTNYSTKLSRLFLCLLDTMCLVHPHFLTVHLQTSHSISI